MKAKSGTAMRWMIFSVITVVVPVLVAISFSEIVNDKELDFSEIADSIILVVFSVGCNLLAICVDAYLQRKTTKIVLCIWISAIFVFISWMFYIFSLIRSMEHEVIIIGISSGVVIACSILGVMLGIRNDKNENEVIKAMHNNCLKIREKCINTKENKGLEIQVKNSYDLLCDPDNFKRVYDTLDCLKGGVENE